MISVANTTSSISIDHGTSTKERCDHRVQRSWFILRLMTSGCTDMSRVCTVFTLEDVYSVSRVTEVIQPSMPADTSLSTQRSIKSYRQYLSGLHT
jgi:hypothetical protein